MERRFYFINPVLHKQIALFFTIKICIRPILLCISQTISSFPKMKGCFNLMKQPFGKIKGY
ncbi:MAG: hypothetical protein LBL74_08230 [Bacteroidales bacterium]|jgi:hypothetical protein|nr:hypothetical protein [Bacteroidales bacterium]